jgi:predicted MFS family arabinose efflux permease
MTMTASVTLPENPSGIRWNYVYAVLLLTIVNAFNYMDRMVLAVLAEPIKQDLGLSDAKLGLLTGFAFVAIYAAVGLPLARLADRIGRRWVLAGSLAVWSVMTVLSGTARTFTQLALFRTGVGVGEAGGMPSSYALLAEIYPPHRRAVPIAVVTAGACIGISAGLGWGGYMAGHYGWRAAFMIVGLPGVILAVIVALTLPEPKRVTATADSVPQLSFLQTIRRLFGISTYRWLMFAHPFYSFVTAGLVVWLPPFYMRTHGMAVETVGAFFGIAYGFGMVLGGIVGAWVLQVITRKAPERALYYAGRLLVLAFPMFAGAMIVSSQAGSLVLITLFGAMSGGAGPPIIAGQQGVIGSRARAVGSAMSVFFAAYIGGGLGPLLVGMGSDAFAPMFGPDALRASLVIASVAIIPPGIFLMIASRHYASDATE